MSRKATSPQWKSIADGVRAAIESGELQPGERLASEIDLAAQWNVSAVTAHKAMRELQREGWVVRKRRVGTVVADRQAMPPRRIAMVFVDFADMPQAGYARGVRDALPNDVKLLPYDTRRDPAREAACLKQIETDREADAIVCYATCAPENTPLFVQVARRMPLAFVDRFPGGFEQHGLLADAVMTDNSGSIQAGMELLRSRGHQRIAYFMEDAAPLISSVRERLTGYRQFMEERGEAPDRWVRALSRVIPVATYFARVLDHLEELLRGPEPVTAVCCQQDKLQAAVLEACVHLGVRVPEELEVLSFSDIAPSLLPMGRSVHRLVQRSEEMGGMAARRLLMRLEYPELLPQVIRVLADLHPATISNPRSRPRPGISRPTPVSEIRTPVKAAPRSRNKSSGVGR
jgi:DNA-binding LacI/PurR family transcriptional regulator